MAIGIIPTVAPYLLPLVLPALAARHPRLHPQLRETQTGPLLAELSAGRIDCAILAAGEERADLESRPLFADRFLLALPAAEAGGLPERVEAAAVPAERLLLLEEGTACATRRSPSAGASRPPTSRRSAPPASPRCWRWSPPAMARR